MENLQILEENISITGKLEFIDLFKPFKLLDNDGNLVMDISKHYYDMFTKLNGKRVAMISTIDSITFEANDEVETKLRYEDEDEDKLILLENGVNMSNIGAYLPNTLQQLNGRTIILEMTKDSISIKGDEMEQVPGLWYTRNNSCAIPDNIVEKSCQPGTINTCIFLTAGGEGFECAKFDSPSARMLLDRYSKGQMRASRIGNCKVLGRNEPPPKPFKLEDYPALVKVMGRKKEFIGGSLLDHGDSMDRRIFGGEIMKTTIKDMDFKDDGSFEVIGEDFTCGFSLKYSGGVSSHTDDEIVFYGYGGHEWKITKV